MTKRWTANILKLCVNHSLFSILQLMLHQVHGNILSSLRKGIRPTWVRVVRESSRIIVAPARKNPKCEISITTTLRKIVKIKAHRLINMVYCTLRPIQISVLFTVRYPRILSQNTAQIGGSFSFALRNMAQQIARNINYFLRIPHKSVSSSWRNNNIHVVHVVRPKSEEAEETSPSKERNIYYSPRKYICSYF